MHTSEILYIGYSITFYMFRPLMWPSSGG